MRGCLTLSLMVAAVRIVSAQPSFSSGIESIRVDVLVSENGKPVLGLGPADFEVRDNGTLQSVDLANYEEIPLNVVLALDMSASVDQGRLEDLRRAGRTLVDSLKPGDQAALLTFTHLVTQRAPLSSDFSRLRSAFDRVSPSGHTNLVDAAFAGMMMGEAEVGRSLLIVFSDGVDATSWLTADEVVETAKRSDVVVYGITAGLRRPGFLTDLCAASGGRLVEIESTQNLDATFRRILDEFRQRYLISYTPQGVPNGGWHRLDVRVKGRSATVRARPGYLAH